MTADPIEIAPINAQFDRWQDLLDLMRSSFAYMAPLIDPPSSALRLTPATLQEKAERETGFVARDNATLAGCIFCLPEPDCLYVGKLAVAPAYQKNGLGRRLLTCAEDLARRHGLAALRLQTRIQLTGNHRTFAAWGFIKTGESRHAGFAEPTTVEMHKPLETPAAPVRQSPKLKAGRATPGRAGGGRRRRRGC